MAGRSTVEMIASAGSKVNGWLKVVVVVGAIVGSVFTLKADVRANTKENERQEVAHEKARNDLREQHLRDMQQINDKLKSMDDKLDRLIEREIRKQ